MTRIDRFFHWFDKRVLGVDRADAMETIKPVENRVPCTVCDVGVIIDGKPCQNCAWRQTKLTGQLSPEPVTFYLFEDGTKDTWCRTCQLSTGFELTVSMLSDSGVTMNVATARCCRRCGAANE